jgi:hypothetical protein
MHYALKLETNKSVHIDRENGTKICS